jgi:hypothetical protein
MYYYLKVFLLFCTEIGAHGFEAETAVKFMNVLMLTAEAGVGNLLGSF